MIKVCKSMRMVITVLTAAEILCFVLKVSHKHSER